MLTILHQLFAIQRWIYDSLTADLREFATDRNWFALIAVLPAGVLFGALHALTPGHSKSILASYLLATRLAPLRAILVSTILALTHVGSAVLIVLLALPIVTRSLVGAGQAPSLEFLSRGLLLFIGCWLLYRAWRGHTHAHHEGLAAGFVAGLVPCPLTLMVMFYAVSRKVPEAGLTFAAAMMLGVLVTLSSFAVATVLARDTMLTLTSRHGASIERLARIVNAFGGVLLIVIAAHELRS
jgi:ABC-type nickel/cobalt efflux system permease component RcnA